MNINEVTVVKGAVALVVGLPLSLGAFFAMNSASNLATVAAELLAEKSSQEAQIEDLKAELTGPCVRYLLSKGDSKLERESKNDIDEVLGGEVSHSNVCQWAL